MLKTGSQISYSFSSYNLKLSYFSKVEGFGSGNPIPESYLLIRWSNSLAPHHDHHRSPCRQHPWKVLHSSTTPAEYWCPMTGQGTGKERFPSHLGESKNDTSSYCEGNTKSHQQYTQLNRWISTLAFSRARHGDITMKQNALHRKIWDVIAALSPSGMTSG